MLLKLADVVILVVDCTADCVQTTAEEFRSHAARSLSGGYDAAAWMLFAHKPDAAATMAIADVLSGFALPDEFPVVTTGTDGSGIRYGFAMAVRLGLKCVRERDRRGVARTTPMSPSELMGALQVERRVPPSVETRPESPGRLDEIGSRQRSPSSRVEFPVGVAEGTTEREPRRRSSRLAPMPETGNGAVKPSPPAPQPAAGASGPVSRARATPAEVEAERARVGVPESVALSSVVSRSVDVVAEPAPPAQPASWVEPQEVDRFDRNGTKLIDGGRPPSIAQPRRPAPPSSEPPPVRVGQTASSFGTRGYPAAPHSAPGPPAPPAPPSMPSAAPPSMPSAAPPSMPPAAPSMPSAAPPSLPSAAPSMPPAGMPVASRSASTRRSALKRLIAALRSPLYPDRGPG
jgi:hypothetical protein